jgi:hypothetical protein
MPGPLQSSIERARFAQQLEATGYDRDTIMSALSVDKTTVSRMISVASLIPDADSMFSGPLTTLILTDQGVDVIKMENPDGGDHVRAANNRGDGYRLIPQKQPQQAQS